MNPSLRKRRLLATFVGVSGAVAGWALILMDWLAAPSHRSPHEGYAAVVFLFAVLPPVFLFINDPKAFCRLTFTAATGAFLAEFGCPTSMTMDQRLRWALTNPLAFPPTCVAIGAATGIVVGIWYPEIRRVTQSVLRTRRR